MGNQELVITRVFDAPRERVWQAWTRPEIMKRWWGPKSFTAPVCRIDLRVGGAYHCCMRSAEGRDYWSTGRYLQITPGKEFVATDSFADEAGRVVPASHYGMHGSWPLELRVTVTLEDMGGQTRLTLRHAGLPSGPLCDQTEAGWHESFQKLAEVLDKD